MHSAPRPRRLLARRAAVGTAAVSLVVVGLPAVASAAPTTPYISEIHYDDAGTDTGEFVEVAFPAGSPTGGWTVELYNGSGGSRYDSDSVTPNAQGVGVVTYNGTLRNGEPDGVALVRDGQVAEFFSYEGVMVAGASTASGRTSIDIGVRQSGSDPLGYTLSRRYDPTTGSLTWTAAAEGTPGAPDPDLATGPDPEPMDVCATTPTHAVGQVQGDGDATPLAGQTVTVRGTVVGDLPEFDGFHLQDAGDTDPATSDGVFVYAPGAEVALGDEVAVTGTSGERFGQTQVSAGTGVAVCTEDLVAEPQAAPLDLPADDAGRERLEGMLVEPVDALTVSEVFGLTRYGELTLSEGGVLVQPTEVARPGTPEAEAVAAGNVARSIVLDDGSDRTLSPSMAPYLTPDAPVRVGDTVTFTEPVVLGYAFESWRLQPADGSADGVFAPRNSRPAAPDEVGGDVRIGAFNVLNYFLTLSGPDARGATSAAEFEQQAGKIVPAINALGADVVTLMEIEDTDSTGRSPGDADAALADLVGRLDADAGSDTWAYVPLPDELYAVDRDVIRNAIIYKHGVVQPVGDPVGLVDESVWDNAREPQAQTFSKDGDVFTVVANHFKSKSPGTPPPPAGDPNADSGDGQGAFNADRVAQAGSLARFITGLRQVDPDVISLGDYNAYTQEDPIVALRGAGLTDLGERFDPGRYSYVFDAASGSLDHALGTAELTAKVTGAAHWNVNSVESSAYQYSGAEDLYAANPYRSSDHDPLLVGIDLDERCNGLVPTIRGTAGDDVLRGGNGVDVVMGLGGDDTITGGNGDDVVCGGAGNDSLTGDNGDDRLLGGFGVDRLDGADGDDTLVGGPGDDDVLTPGCGAGSQEQGGAES